MHTVRTHYLYAIAFIYCNVCLFSERLYNLRALNRSEQRACHCKCERMLNIRCWLFADLNIRSHHSQLTFSPSLSHLSVRSCASISFILILCAFLFNDDYSLDISAMCIYSSSSSLLFAVVVVYKFVVLSSLLFRLNCMRVFAAQM